MERGEVGRRKFSFNRPKPNIHEFPLVNDPGMFQHGILREIPKKVPLLE